MLARPAVLYATAEAADCIECLNLHCVGGVILSILRKEPIFRHTNTYIYFWVSPDIYMYLCIVCNIYHYHIHFWVNYITYLYISLLSKKARVLFYFLFLINRSNCQFFSNFQIYNNTLKLFIFFSFVIPIYYL